MKIFICDGNQRSALAVARSLGKRGYEVTVGDELEQCLAGASRFVKQVVCYPSPSRFPREFQGWLVDSFRKTKYDLLIPCTDKTCLLTLEIEGQIREQVNLALPPKRVFMQAFDKYLIVETARRIGMGAPETLLVKSESDLEEAAKSINYPAVLKVHQSHMLSEAGWSGGPVVYVDSAEDALIKYRNYKATQPLMLQERVQGVGCGYFALLRDGEPLAEFSHERLREKPPTGGVSVLCKSVAIDPKLRSDSLRLLRELEWEGVAMVECKRDSVTGEHKIMEVNCRVWGSLQLAIDSGVDFPVLLCQLFTTGSVEKAAPPRVGVISRWLLGDLDHMVAVLRRGRPGTRGVARLLSRFGAIFSFFVTFLRITHGSVLRFNDPAPWFAELKQYLGWYVKKVVGGR